jgi:phosphoribosylformylglycinamidine cyclo-ligase
VHAFSHITGGGLAGNLVRVLPGHLDAVVDRATWSPPAIFQYLASQAPIGRRDLEPALNLGVGMIAAVSAESAVSALALLAARGVPAWRIGEVVPGNGTVLMQGDYLDCRF